MTKLSAVFPDDVAALLKQRAQAEDRSVGAVIRRAVAEHVGHVPAGIPGNRALVEPSAETPANRAASTTPRNDDNGR